MADGFGEFVSGLLKAFSSGAQGTADAFQQDVDSVSRGTLPSQAIKAGGQIIGAMGNPSVNPVTPALKWSRQVFDPNSGWKTAEEKIIPGGDWFTLFMRQGGFGDFFQTLLKAMEKGK